MVQFHKIVWILLVCTFSVSATDLLYNQSYVSNLQSQLEILNTQHAALKYKYNSVATKCGVIDENPKTCKAHPIDVVFLLDSSGSISATDYRLQLDFVKSIVEMLDFRGQSGTILTTVQFSTWPQTERGLFRNSNKAEILRNLDKLRHIKGWTKLAKAIRLVNKKHFVIGKTTRKGALQVLIVLTDGRSQDGVGNIVDLHRKKVLVIAIGVGEKIDASQLRALATPGYYHKAIDFGDLAHYKEKLTQSICNKKVITVCENKCEKSCSKTVDETTSTCSQRAPIDIILVIDSSASITANNTAAYTELTAFLEASMAAMAFNGDKSGTVGSLIQFSTSHQSVFRYEDDKNKIMHALSKMKHMRGGTNLKGVLKFVNKYWLKFTDQHKYGVLRRDAKPIVVIITDARDNDDGTDDRPAAYAEVRKMHDLGILTHAIGVGQVNRAHLTKLASPHPENGYVHLEPSYSELLLWQEHFSKQICTIGEIQVCAKECTEVCTKKEVLV